MARWLESADPASALGGVIGYPLGVDNPDELLNKLISFCTNSSADTLTIAAGGAGYSASQIISLDGGTFPAEFPTNGAPMTAQVVTVDGGGGITSIRMRNAGCYATVPAGGPFTTTRMNGAAGAGATLNVTFQAGLWSILTNDLTVDAREIILQSNLAGGPIVGIRSYAIDALRKNLELAGLPAHTVGSTFGAQPNISPGRNDGIGTDRVGAYVPLRDLEPNSTYNFFFRVSDRHIHVLASPEASNYPSGYIGFGDQQALPSDHPTPLVVSGSANDAATAFDDPGEEWGGIPVWITKGAGASFPRGPMLHYTPGGNWGTVRNARFSGGNILAEDAFGSAGPCGSFDDTSVNIAIEDRLINSPASQSAWPDFASPATAGSPRVIGEIPGTVPQHPRFDIDYQDVEAEVAIYGTLRDVFWIPRRTPGGGNLNPEDELVDANGIDVYKAFPCGKNILQNHWHAVKVTP